MKAEIINDFYASNFVKNGDVVEIIKGMEADAADVLNAPIGMCYLCKCPNEEETMLYIPATSLKLIGDGDSVDWEQRRYEIAKTILPYWAKAAGGLLESGRPKNDIPQIVAKTAVVYADALIAELRKPQPEPETESIPERKDVAIGEVVEFQGEHLLCVEKTDGDDCTGCAFISKDKDCNFSGYCSKEYRNDGKDVIFLKGK